MTPLPGEAPPQASSRLSPQEAADNFLRRLPTSCRLLVALSGGGDSTGLLAALSGAAETYPGITLHSATVDHALRSGSAAEAQAAHLLSRKLGVSNVILKWAGEKPASGIQAAARDARYRLLADEAERVHADFIVTGHTLDDQSETVFMRALRKPVAVEGMDEAVLVDRRVWVVRPFLKVGREAIRDYLRKRRLSWSEDPSNDNPAFERVRIRQSGVLAGGISAVEHTPNPYTLSAQLVRDHVKVHAGPVAAVDLRGCHVRSSACWTALAALAAVVGGRVYGPGREAEAAIIDKLARSTDFRMTANRVVFDRCGHIVYIYREARGLADVTIAPGMSAFWDGRYEISNHGALPATVTAGSAVSTALPLVPFGQNGALPRDVARRAAASAPRVVTGDAGSLRVRPILAPFDKFLPARKLGLANSLAAAFELEQFPLLSLGDGAF